MIEVNSLSQKDKQIIFNSFTQWLFPKATYNILVSVQSPAHQ